jgi:PhnB protein
MSTTKDGTSIPEDYQGVIASLAFRSTADALKFYADVFGAEEVMRLADPTGKIGHAEMRVGGGKFMLADEFPPYNATPGTVGGNSVVLHLHVPDVDATVARATEAGAKLLMPPSNQFYGDRSARVEDPFGYVWSLATRIEEVSPEECLRRWNAWLETQKGN